MTCGKAQAALPVLAKPQRRDSYFAFTQEYYEHIVSEAYNPTNAR